MPQFDTFIFTSSLIYFIPSFFIYLYYNSQHFLPTLASILKLRYKLAKKKSLNLRETELNNSVSIVKEISNLFNK